MDVAANQTPPPRPRWKSGAARPEFTFKHTDFWRYLRTVPLGFVAGPDREETARRIARNAFDLKVPGAYVIATLREWNRHNVVPFRDEVLWEIARQERKPGAKG